jgi:hypothetical protein
VSNVTVRLDISRTGSAMGADTSQRSLQVHLQAPQRQRNETNSGVGYRDSVIGYRGSGL